MKIKERKKTDKAKGGISFALFFGYLIFNFNT